MKGSASGSRIVTGSEPAAITAGVGYRKLKARRGIDADVVARDQVSRIRHALVDLVSERGYDAAGVRELVRRAGVSTSTFYQRCRSKQDCVLEIHDLIMAAASRRLEAAVERGGGAHGGIRIALEELAAGLVEQPEEARFACVDATAAGLEIVERERRSREHFEALVTQLLEDDSGRTPPPMLVRGIVAGLAQVVRSRLIDDRITEFTELVDDLDSWVRLMNAPQVAELKGDFRVSPCATITGEAFTFPQRTRREQGPDDHERDLLLSAALDLAVKAGYWRLTERGICEAAGVSRGRFRAHFTSVEECFLATLNLVAERAMDFISATIVENRDDWPAGFHQAVCSLCAFAAAEPRLARLAMVEILTPGPVGLSGLSHLIQYTAERYVDGLPPRERPSLVAAEASMGAIWGLVHDSVAAGNPEQLTELAPLLTFFGLAPIIGAGCALAAVTKLTAGQPVAAV